MKNARFKETLKVSWGCRAYSEQISDSNFVSESKSASLQESISSFSGFWFKDIGPFSEPIALYIQESLHQLKIVKSVAVNKSRKTFYVLLQMVKLLPKLLSLG